MNHQRSENTRTSASPRTWWQPSSTDLTRASAELSARRGALAEVALGVVVIDSRGCRARVVFGASAAVTVGRHCATDVLLDGSDASLRHLVFAREGKDVVVFDLASTHGCEVTSSRAASGAPLVVKVGDAFVFACCVDASATFPVLTPALVRDAQPLRVRLVVPDMRELPQAPPLALTKEGPSGGRSDGWRPPLFTGQLPLVGLLQPVLIGRQPRNDLILDDDRVSRVHAVVLPPGTRGHALLVDVGSSNGTTVTRAGRAVELGVVQRCAAIHPGDLVELGETQLQVVGPPDARRVVYDETPWTGGEA